MSTYVLKYNSPGPVASAFAHSEAEFKVIMGPFGSGKSVMCIMSILSYCMKMEKGPDGFRRSKWGIIRNTAQQLRDTTLATWLRWIPDGVLGHWKSTDMIFQLAFKDVRADILFRPLDRPEDIQRVLSMEYTGTWFNECREIPLEIVIAMQGRVGRYPPKEDVWPYYCPVIGDTNPPEIDSEWWKVMEGLPQKENEPDSILECAAFHQPSGLSPEAENINNLRPGYYEQLAKGKKKAWVDQYVHGMYALSQVGKPVYEDTFDFERHVAEGLPILSGYPVIVGVDGARNPAMTFQQMRPDGKIYTLKEAVGFSMGAQNFIAMKVKPLVRSFFSDCPLIFILDPACTRQNDTDDNSWYKEIKKQFKKEDGHKVKFANTNDPITRINATDIVLSTWPMGKPLNLIDKGCTYLIMGLRSKYRYVRVKSGEGKYQDKPEKNDWSHIVESKQYADLFINTGTFKPEDYPAKSKGNSRFTGIGRDRLPADSYAGY